VSGTVTYKGKEVQTGRVSFLGKDGAAESAPIIKGKYKVPNAPLGEVQVGVAGSTAVASAPDMKMHPPTHAKVAAQRVGKGGAPVSTSPTPSAQIPPSYLDPRSSGLQGFEIKKGKNSHDIAVP
jgi:hypothetical protein